jgi:uncharacterized Zn-finger protein
MADESLMPMSSMNSGFMLVELKSQDLEGPGVVFCPNKKMTLWNAHPRVFIDVATTGEGKCAYCGTVYRLIDGENRAKAH